MMNRKMAFSMPGFVMIAAGLIGASLPVSAEEHAAADSWITAKVKLSLAADARVKGRQVSVTTERARVTLRGKVDTDEAKAAAEEIAGGVEKVAGVQNDLQVVAPARRDGVSDRDEAVTERVRKLFSNHADLRDAGISVTTNAGVVSLTGEVRDLVTSAKASWEARKIDGVRSVKNDLTIRD